MQEVEVQDVSMEVIDDPSKGIEMAQPSIILHALPDQFNEEIELRLAEEIIGDEHQDHIPNVSEAKMGLEVFTVQPSGDQSGKGEAKRAAKENRYPQQNDRELTLEEMRVLDPSGSRKWERKLVNLKTLFGEIPVVMWASG